MVAATCIFLTRSSSELSNERELTGPAGLGSLLSLRRKTWTESNSSWRLPSTETVRSRGCCSARPERSRYYGSTQRLHHRNWWKKSWPPPRSLFTPPEFHLSTRSGLCSLEAGLTHFGHVAAFRFGCHNLEDGSKYHNHASRYRRSAPLQPHKAMVRDRRICDQPGIARCAGDHWLDL